MEQALGAWDSARQLRDAPAPLHALIAELRRGTVTFHVQMSDAASTPLSTMGFQALLETSGLFDLNRISAQSILRLIKTEPLVTHVLYAAWMRQQVRPTPDEPVGFEAMC